MDDLAIDLDYFTTWAQRNSRNNPYDMPLDELRENDRCAYLQHLDRWARNEISERLESSGEILERIDEERNEKAAKQARAIENMENGRS